MIEALGRDKINALQGQRCISYFPIQIPCEKRVKKLRASEPMVRIIMFETIVSRIKMDEGSHLFIAVPFLGPCVCALCSRKCVVIKLFSLTYWLSFFFSFQLCFVFLGLFVLFAAGLLFIDFIHNLDIGNNDIYMS